MAKRIEETILTLLKTGFKPEGVESHQLEEGIRSKGSKGMGRTEFYEISRGSRNHESTNRLNILLNAERVVWFKRETNGRGRPGEFFVHCDHVEQHEKDFPQHRRVDLNGRK